VGKKREAVKLSDCVPIHGGFGTVLKLTREISLHMGHVKVEASLQMIIVALNIDFENMSPCRKHGP